MIANPDQTIAIPLPTQLATWLSKLVQIPSVNPAQAGPRAGTPGEARIARQIAEWFQQLGGEVHSEEVSPGRPNVYGIWTGRSDRWLAVDVHTDTVSVEQMSGDPFSGEIKEGRVYGRGAVDTKASLAVVLALLEEMQRTRQQPAHNIVIGATVDEEIDTTGAPAFARWIERTLGKVQQIIVAEPTLCQPIHGHKGVVRYEFHVQGQATHSSQPHLGKNAIVAAARLVLAMQAEHDRLQAPAFASPVGNPMLTVSLMQGGAGINVVPDHCMVAIDRRVVAGEKLAEVQAGLLQLAEQSCPLPMKVTPLNMMAAFYQPADSPLVGQLAEWTGNAAEVAPYGTNAFAYGEVTEECVVFGPGSIDQAHGAVEWVAISELEKAAAVYRSWWES